MEPETPSRSASPNTLTPSRPPSRNASALSFARDTIGAGDWVSVASGAPEHSVYGETLMFVEERDAASGMLHVRPMHPVTRIALPEASAIVVRSAAPSPRASPRASPRNAAPV